jgi:DNA repair exonuclease SbcCD ATPase subunit
MQIILEDVYRYKSTSVEIPEGVSFIVGKWYGDDSRSNGTGKSSFIEGGIGWCLWGEARTTDEYPAGDALIRRPPQKRIGKASFGLNGLRVTRERKYLKSTKLYVEYKGVDKTHPTKLKLTQQTINNLLGIDYDIFSKTLYIPAGGVGLFTALGPTEAKGKVSELLALQRWQEWYKKVSADLNEIVRNTGQDEAIVKALEEDLIPQDEIDKMAYSIVKDTDHVEVLKSHNLDRQYEENILIVNLGEINNRLGEHAANIKRCTEDMRASEVKIQNLKLTIERVKGELAKDREDLASLEKSIDNQVTMIEKLNEEHKANNVEQVKANKLELEQAHIKILEQINEKKILCDRERENLKRERVIRERLEAGQITCPIIEQHCPVLDGKSGYQIQLKADLDQVMSEMEDIIDEFDRNLLIDNGARIQLVDNINKMNEEINKSDKRLEEINRLEKVHLSYIASSNRYTEGISRYNDELVECEKRIKEEEQANMERSLDMYRLQSKDLKGDEQQKEEYELRLIEIKEAQKITNVLIEQTQQNVTTLKQKINDNIAKETRIALAKTKLIRSQEDLNNLRILAKAFHVDGIPTYIISMVSDEIEMIANDILEMAEHDSRISIKLKEDTKTKDPITNELKEKDVFKINVTSISDGVDADYISNSSGEAFWIDFAIRVALSITTRNRNTGLLNMLLIDEGMGVLDTRGRSKFIDIIHKIRSKYLFDYIWIITHTTILNAKEMADNIITCHRKDDISWIEVE